MPHIPYIRLPALAHLRPVRHQLRRILFIHRIRYPPLRPPSPPLLHAAQRPHPNADGNGHGDGAEDCDLGAVGEAVEALGDAQGRRGAEDLRGGGVSGDRLDGLPGSGRVAVFVLAAGGEVGYADGLDEHCVGTLGVVDFPAGPLDGVVAVIFVPACPDADADVHGRLRVVGSSVRVGVRQRTHDGSVDVPFQ